MEPEIIGKRVTILMEKHHLKVTELADKMGIEQVMLKHKLEGKEEFYLDEMKKIKDIFQLDIKDCDELFFQEDAEIDKM